MEKNARRSSRTSTRRKSETKARRNGGGRYIFRRRGLNAPDISRRPIPRLPPSLPSAPSDPPFFCHHDPRQARARAPKTSLTQVESPSFGLPTSPPPSPAVCGSLPSSLARSFAGADGVVRFLRRVTCEAKRASESTLSMRIIHQALK